MEHFLWYSWWISLIIITGYYLFVFRIRETGPLVDTVPDARGVSIVIAIKNGSETFSQHLHSILHQDYPLYEIIIVDDHSTTEERNGLVEMISRNSQITLIHSDRQPGKKHALSLGIEKSKYPLVLCTDADCRPVSDQWIRTMVTRSNGQNVVLGYSPYTSSPGLLNLFIRFETVMTAMQYLSWTMLGRPYMGVGRNMLYPRTLFHESDPYRHHPVVPYGDDDLWIQSAMHKSEIDVCLEPDSFVISAPAGSWKKWFRQKHRHLSAGRYYSFSTWWQPALFGAALIWHWVLVIPLAILNFHLWVLIVFGVALCTRWYAYSKWTRRLGDRDTMGWYPLLEILYALYLVLVGGVTLLKKKKTWN